MRVVVANQLAAAGMGMGQPGNLGAVYFPHYLGCTPDAMLLLNKQLLTCTL